MNSTLSGSTSLHPSTPSSQELRQHRRNISTDSCDYEKLPSSARIRTIKKHLISKSSVTEDAKKVLDRFLKHLTQDEERLLRNYFGVERQEEPADEHTYVSYSSAKHVDRSKVEDSSDVYQSFRQFHDQGPAHHHYYDIDQSPRTSKRASQEDRRIPSSKPTQTSNIDNAPRSSSHVRAEEYISRLCLGRCSESPSAKSMAPPTTTSGEDEYDRASSSSTEDYEFPDKELINRKKKSTFRLALERVQQSFKKQKEKTSLTTSIETSEPLTHRTRSQSRSSKKRHQSKKSSKSEERVKYNKNFFEAIIYQLKRKGFKLGRKPVKDDRSRSADNLNTIIRPLKPEEKKLLERYRHAGYDSDSNAKGQDFRPRRPRMPLPPDVFKDSSQAMTQGEPQGTDEFDGDEDKNSSSSSIIPFNLKTVEEKDELFGRIADQLAAIADDYKMAGFWSKEDPCTSIECPKGLTLDQYIPIRNSTQAQLNSQSALSPSSIAAELAVSPSYSKFEEILSANVGLGQTGWSQVAFVFRLTRSAVHLAGMGTSVACTIREFALKYFEEKFAAWIADRGGWESMVEDGNNTELNSELD